MNEDGKDARRKPRIDWEDPMVPVGDAPKLPRWPLVLAALAWAAWVVFLVLMLMSRKNTPWA